MGQRVTHGLARERGAVCHTWNGEGGAVCHTWAGEVERVVRDMWNGEGERGGTRTRGMVRERRVAHQSSLFPEGLEQFGLR